MAILLISIIFLAVLIWLRHGQGLLGAETERLKAELFETQSGLAEAERRAQQLAGFLAALHEQKVSHHNKGSWSTFCDFVVYNTSLLLDAETVVLLQWNVASGLFEGAAARGLSPQKLSELKFRPGEGSIGRAAQSGKLSVLAETDSLLDSGEAKILSLPLIVIPLWVHSRIQGILIFSQLKKAKIQPDSVRLAGLVGKHLELLMENLDLGRGREQLYGELVSTLRLALGAKDASGQSHADACSDLVRAIGKELHLPAMLIEQIEYAALLHDVGKLGVSESLLNKPGPLTPEEYEIVKKHPIIGAQILCEVEFLKAVVPIVLYHHEWVNGQGYPEGLAGEEIPLGARIIAIVDAWDTMTKDQPYRPALSKSNAIAELRQQAGAQFDPKLIDVFIRAMDKIERASSQIAATAATPHA